MDWAPYARIAARYIIGGVGGTAVGDAVLNDPDLMNLLTIATETEQDRTAYFDRFTQDDSSRLRFCPSIQP